MFDGTSDLILIEDSRLNLEIMKKANKESLITVITGSAEACESTCKRKLVKHI